MALFHEMFEAYLVREWMIIIILFQAVIVSCIFLLLVVQKLRIEKLQRRKIDLEKFYTDAICRYLNNSSNGVAPPKSHISFEALIEAAIELMAGLEEAEKVQTRVLLGDLGVVDYYLRMAESSSWLKRFYAVERLGLLGISDLRDYFIDVLRRDGSFPVRVRAIWSLSLIADEEVLRIITEALVTEIAISSKFNEYIYTNIITSFRNKGLNSSFPAFLAELLKKEEVPFTLKKEVIEACGSTALQEASQHIVEFHARFESSAEMKITCVRAVGRIFDSKRAQASLLSQDDTGMEEIIISGLVDKDWRVRAVSAGSIFSSQEQTIRSLRKLLYDPVFYVRRNAGRALTRLGEKGFAVLKEETASGDKFVRDNVNFVLAVVGFRK